MLASGFITARQCCREREKRFVGSRRRRSVLVISRAATGTYSGMVDLVAAGNWYGEYRDAVFFFFNRLILLLVAVALFGKKSSHPCIIHESKTVKKKAAHTRHFVEQ